MEYFDIKINYFDGQNLPQRPFSLFKPESSDSLSLSLFLNRKRLNKEENEVRYQNVLSSNSRD